MKNYKIVFTGRKEICENTYSFTFNLNNSGYEFKPGQYAHFTIQDPVIKDENGNSRPLSFASSPHHKNTILIAGRNNHSVFIENMLSLVPGAEVFISEPEGDISLSPNESVENVFIAGGIGITPVRSIIEFATENDLKNKITLFYSNKSLLQSAFLNDFINWSEMNDNFRLITFLDDTKNISGFDNVVFESGRIDSGKLKKHLKNFENKNYYLIGPPEMVDSMKELLIKEKVSEEKIKTEKFK